MTTNVSVEVPVARGRLYVRSPVGRSVSQSVSQSVGS